MNTTPLYTNHLNEQTTKSNYAHTWPGYNGWANYETWNVSLWIQNDYGMYKTAQEWVNERLLDKQSIDYDVFKYTMIEMFGDKTKDGVSWDDDNLNREELSELLEEYCY